MTEPDIAPQPESEPPRPHSGLGGISAGTRDSRRSGNKLYSGGLLAVAVTLGYYAYATSTSNPLHLYLGMLIFIGAALPALTWARRENNRFPVFEVFMLTGINTYAIPLLSGHQQLQLYPDEIITRTALAVLLFQLVANLTFALTSGRPKTTPNWTEEVITSNIVDYLSYGMLLTTAYSIVSLFTDWIPRDIIGVVRAVSFGVGTISTFVQSRMWGQGTLPNHRKGTFVFQLVLQVVFSFASLSLISGISILVLGLLGYVSGGKKIPLIPLIVGLPLIALLHNGKTAMREKYWEGGAPFPTVAEVPAFFVEWFEVALSSENSDGSKKSKSESIRVLERTSLFHMFCLVVDCTPDRQPYLDGETYGYVPAQFVPAFFWHDKPSSHVATNRLAIYYGLQDDEATNKTTIAFGLISEAYANFGLLGVAFLGGTFAFWLKKLSDWSAHSPILSYPGLLLIVLMAWSFQSELTMAAWLGSLYQAIMAVVGAPFVLRNVFGR